MSTQKIVVLGTGGTIAGSSTVAGDNVGYTAAQVGIGELLSAIPRLSGMQVEAEQVAQLDSKDMTFGAWQLLAARCTHWLAQPDVKGIVITHGTDTLEETAFFLQAVLNPDKPIVLTCAMRPSTATAPDGPQNVLDAMAVAATAGARGVVAVCAGVVHGAADVQKVHPYRLDAFSSGDSGPVGYVEEGALRRLRSWPDAPVMASAARVAMVSTCPRVEIVMSHAGAGRGVVDALVAQGVHGIVAAATGNGTLHVDLEAALLDAQATGVKVLRATRCPEGRVIRGPGDAPAAIADSAGLSPVKARIALMLAAIADPASA